MPGKFIISPRPQVSGHVMVSATCAASMLEPVSSTPRTAGTHDGVVSMILSGVRAASCHMAFTPSRPRTFATSCGSA